MQSPRLGFRCAPFYNKTARHPELPKYRLFGPQWTKKLFDDSEEVLEKQKTVNDELAKLQFQTQSGAGLNVLDCPRSFIKNNRDVYAKWMDYENFLQAYTERLCLVHELYKLPSHAPYFGKYLKKFSELFRNDIFVPTGESALEYQDPTRPDFAAVFNARADILTNLCVNNIGWIKKHIPRRLRRLWNWRRPQQIDQENTIRLATIVSCVDFATCIFVSLLLTAVMFALVSVRPLKARIALVGVFGLTFSCSAKACNGSIGRGEIFAYTAAFFAIASVFVGTTTGSTPEDL